MFILTTNHTTRKPFLNIRDAIIYAVRELHADGCNWSLIDIKKQLLARPYNFADGAKMYDLTIRGEKENFNIMIWET